VKAPSLPLLGTGLVDLEDAQPGGERRLTLGEGVEARPEEDVLPDTPGGLALDQIFDEARAPRWKRGRGG
jgi:hypothetical protein